MALTYQQYVDTMKLELVIGQNDNGFTELLPRMIEYAELRIYRDFDFLCTLGPQTVALTQNIRSVQLPTSIVVAESANIVTPAGQTNPDSGTRVPLTRATVDFLNSVYNSVSGAAVPQYYAIQGAPVTSGTITAGNYNVLLGPWPDQAYTLEIIGTVRPAPLSSSNSPTFISTNLPDLFVAASMIYGSGAMLQNFGQQSDNPQLAVSWEQQYQTLKAGIMVEELRKKAMSAGGSVFPPSTGQAA